MRELFAAMILFGALACAQTFEVASVKPSPAGGRSNIDTTPGSVTMRNVNIPLAIMWAYNVSPWQITGVGPASEDRYEIQAKAAGPAKTDEMRTMLQALLADRFKLAVHRETKEMQAYALVEAKGGHKMKVSESDTGKGIIPIEDKRIALEGQSASLEELARFLAMPLRTPVINQTGLQGKFDFTFDITAYIPRDGDRQPGDPPPDPVSILQANLTRQLGLKLEARKLPIEMVVVDHVEKAKAEN